MRFSSVLSRCLEWTPLRRLPLGGLLATLLLPGLAIAAGLNDTGVTQCADDSSNNVSCNNASFPRQDAETGRDAQKIAGTLSKAGGGLAGFDFTKLDSAGAPLDASAASWDCVRDNVTGLIWEVKTDDSGLRDKDWTYTWYNPDPQTNGGNSGSTGGASRSGFLRCNIQSYTAAVNALNPALCGYTDWRMPTIEELRSIVDYSIYDRTGNNPTIDAAYFPNTRWYAYWSASPYAPDDGVAWNVFFDIGNGGAVSKGNAYAVRLVRGGQ